jgi:small conductance mechanosensitive channel
MSWNDVLDLLGNEAFQTLLRIAGVILTGLGLTWLMRRGVRRMEARVAQDTTPLRQLKRTQTLAKVLTSAGTVVLWTIAGIYVVSLIGFDLAPLLAGVGVIGLAIGFGAQNLVKDIVTGFFMLLEDQYGVGDIIEINQVASGTVEELTLRVTGMRDLDGTMHYIANGDISHVANRSKDWARAVIDVGVAYKEDPNKVRAILNQVADSAWTDGSETARKLYAQPQVLGVELLGEYEVVWRMIGDTKPGRQWEAARELRERVKVAFDENGIEIPYPHRVMVTADENDNERVLA